MARSRGACEASQRNLPTAPRCSDNSSRSRRRPGAPRTSGADKHPAALLWLAVKRPPGSPNDCDAAVCGAVAVALLHAQLLFDVAIFSATMGDPSPAKRKSPTWVWMTGQKFPSTRRT